MYAKNERRMRRNVIEWLNAFKSDDKAKIFKLSALNWKQNKTVADLQGLITSDNAKLDHIDEISFVMVDAFFEIKGNGYDGMYRLRFTAQKQAYVPDPNAKFCADPRSFRPAT